MPSTLPTYVRTQNHASTHLCPTFHTLHICRHSTLIRVAEPRWYAPLFYIRMRRSYAVNIADLHSHVLQVKEWRYETTQII